jgi:hypothetical protein
VAGALIRLLPGVGVTFAEPAIGALQAAGQNVSAEQGPDLWVLLNQWTGATPWAIPLGSY